MRSWKEALLQDEAAHTSIVTAGSKRKAVRHPVLCPRRPSSIG